jgi:hypothetical protein
LDVWFHRKKWDPSVDGRSPPILLSIESVLLDLRLPKVDDSYHPGSAGGAFGSSGVERFRYTDM